MAANVDQKEEGRGVDTDEKQTNALSEDICCEFKRRMNRVVAK